MNTTNKLLATFIAIILSIGISEAQEISVADKKTNYCLTLVPQYALLGSIRMDIDKRIANTSHWIVFSPRYTSSYNDALWDISYDRRIGGGLNVYHRYFMNKAKKCTGVYLQYGLVYNYNKLYSEGLGWATSSSNGNDILVEKQMFLTDHIHKYGLDFLVGIQTKIMESMVVDFYAGFGQRYAHITGMRGSLRNDTHGILNPAYQGVLPIGGIRLGVYF